MSFPRVDGSKVRLFGTRKAAEDGIESIGWPKKAATRVSTRFCIAWAIGTGIGLDPHTGLCYVSREWYGKLWHSRNDKRRAAPL